MFCSGLTTALLLAATCLLTAAGVSRAQMAAGFSEPTEERAIICEGAFNARRLSCEGGVIAVQSALYGRADSETCSEGRPTDQLSNTSCSLPGTLDAIKQSCNGKSSCTIKASNSVFGDPCVGTYKYLEVVYKCQH